VNKLYRLSAVVFAIPPWAWPHWSGANLWPLPAGLGRCRGVSQLSQGGPMQRVAVATDRSETAQRAEEWAAAMADRYGADLLVIQVLLPQNDPGTEAGQAEATRASFAAAELTSRAQELAGTRGAARIIVDDD